MTARPGLDNPFTVQTPEDISAEDTLALFVDVFSDFHRVPYPEHFFLHGPRGSGKSMMFRFLQPDCQCLHMKCDVRNLPFLGIYVPVKHTSLDLAELLRIEKQHAAVLLNEHFLVTYIAVKTFGCLAALCFNGDHDTHMTAIKEFYDNVYVRLLKACGWKGRLQTSSHLATVNGAFNEMEAECTKMYAKVVQYLKQVSFSDSEVPYTGELCGYEDFLLPLFAALRRLPFLPDAPAYLLVDDADNLNFTQTRILNSWVSSRSSAQISVKISTQLNYKTYSTVAGRTIDSPHDYAEINIADVYTSPKSPYRKRVEEIVTKRLLAHSISASPESFFPSNSKQ
jgi:hypothetical protein